MANQDDEQLRLLRLIAAPEIRRRKERRLMLGCLVFAPLSAGVVLVLIMLFWKVG